MMRDTPTTDSIRDTMGSVVERWRRGLLNGWSDLPLVDWGLVALVGLLHLLLVKYAGVGFVIQELLKDDRMRIYTTVASVSALVFGFATASIAFFYGTAKGERVDLMKQIMGPRLVASWRAALSAPLIAVGVCILALAGDTGATGTVVAGIAVEISILILAIRCVRLRWLLTSTLSLLAKDVASLAPVAPTGHLIAVERPAKRSISA